MNFVFFGKALLLAGVLSFGGVRASGEYVSRLEKLEQLKKQVAQELVMITKCESDEQKPCDNEERERIARAKRLYMDILIKIEDRSDEDAKASRERICMFEKSLSQIS